MLFVGTMESYKNFSRTLLHKRWTLHKLRRTNVTEVNHWAKVANKTANINIQNRSLYAS